jgi:hypothetical protein
LAQPFRLRVTALAQIFDLAVVGADALGHLSERIEQGLERRLQWLGHRLPYLVMEAIC